jgi:uncharacterized RDD family membrane protein YckC
MQTIRITTSQNIDIDYEIAGLGERILATLIDYAIFFLIGFLCIIMNGIFKSGGSDLISGIIFLVLYVFYDLVCEIFMNGQSIGKRTMKIKVISLDAGQASAGQYFLRWIFRIVDFTLTGGACAIISTAISAKSQRVGDMVASTTLIRTVARTQIDALAFTLTIEDYQPVFTEATQLSDRDIVLIHEVLRSVYKTGNSVVLYNTAAKIKELLNIDTKLSDLDFLQTIIRDYNHIAASEPV